MKSNETSFRHSRAPRTMVQIHRKKSVDGLEFNNTTELSTGTQRRKLEAEERRRLRKERRRARRLKNPLIDETPGESK